MNKLHLIANFALILVFFFCYSGARAQSDQEILVLTKKLEQIYDLDQGVREELRSVILEYGNTSEQSRSAISKMKYQDSLNQAFVFKTIEQYGWLSKNKTSDKASNAIFYVIQHADLPEQMKYQNLIYRAFGDGEISAVEFAIYNDRINVRQGKIQLYGSQTAIDNIGNSFLYPIDQTDSVEFRRSKIGLDSLHQQIANNNIQHVLPSSGSTNYDITLIGHFWKETNEGLKNTSLWDGDKLIGTTNKNGFIFTKYSFFGKPELEITFKMGETIIGKRILKPGKDFYEIYFQKK